VPEISGKPLYKVCILSFFAFLEPRGRLSPDAGEHSRDIIEEDHLIDNSLPVLFPPKIPLEWIEEPHGT
jgi:hypothetical protein